jgi:hypothetical protein
MPSGSLLPSVLKPYGRKVFANRIDSFFNAEGMVWQSWGLLSKLCYLMKQDVEAYCYVAFQPFTKRELAAHMAGARLVDHDVLHAKQVAQA